MTPTIARFILTSALFLFASPATAIQLDLGGCAELAQFAASTAYIRDLGADKDKMLAAVAKANAESEPEVRAILKQLIEGVFASKAVPEELARMTMEMCMRKEGKIGEGA